MLFGAETNSARGAKGASTGWSLRRLRRTSAVLRVTDCRANIMSLGGTAIATGAIVDGAGAMIENAHKHLETWRHAVGRRA
jgi:Cu/Ag efflux pump CusA